MFMSSWYFALIAMFIAGVVYKYIEYRGYVNFYVLFSGIKIYFKNKNKSIFMIKLISFTVQKRKRKIIFKFALKNTK